MHVHVPTTLEPTEYAAHMHGVLSGFVGQKLLLGHDTPSPNLVVWA